MRIRSHQSKRFCHKWQNQPTAAHPTGKRKLPADIRTLARQHTTAALKTLAAIMNDEKAPPSVRVAASKRLSAALTQLEQEERGSQSGRTG
jgi:hypothetical protein